MKRTIHCGPLVIIRNTLMALSCVSGLQRMDIYTLSVSLTTMALQTRQRITWSVKRRDPRNWTCFITDFRSCHRLVNRLSQEQIQLLNLIFLYPSTKLPFENLRSDWVSAFSCLFPAQYSRLPWSTCGTSMSNRYLPWLRLQSPPGPFTTGGFLPQPVANQPQAPWHSLYWSWHSVTTPILT